MNHFPVSNSPSESKVPSPVFSGMDAFRFVKNFYKWIGGFGILGVFAAAAFIAFTPPEYEAVAQIQMAQFGPIGKGLSRTGFNVEEPALLVARLSNPSSFSNEDLMACGLDGQTHSKEILAKKLKINSVKGVGGVVELKVRGSSRNLASNCVNSIFSTIKVYQAQLSALYLADIKEQLNDNYQLLDKVKTLTIKADRSESAMGATYLSTRDEINYLLGEIVNLKNLARASDNQATRLIGSIYVADRPVWPKKSIVLLIGLIIGICVGIAIAHGYKTLTQNG